MTRRLLIIGAGGFGREVLALAEDIASESPRSPWNHVAFLDADPHALDQYELHRLILAAPESYEPTPDDLFTCAVGDPMARLRLSRMIQSRGGHFTTLVHPTAQVGSRSTLGTGVIMCQQALVTVDAELGDFVALNARSGVGHDATLGDGCTLSAFCDVTGYCRLGEGVFLGTHAALLPGTVVGDYAKIAAGSVAYRNVAASATAMGVPAKKLVFPAA